MSALCQKRTWTDGLGNVSASASSNISTSGFRFSVHTGECWVSALQVGDVVAYDRRRVSLAGELHVKDKLAAGQEHHLGANKIKLPHTAKALVIYCRDLGAVGLEAPPPMVQSLSVMHTQKLQIRDP